jgi:hydroxymethylbilane synthase
LRIATRGSRLALWQAEHVACLLRRADAGRRIEVVEVSTSGDRDRNAPLAQLGGVGAFTREVQTAVLEGRADIAVHSLKDLPTESADGLVLAGIPQRGPRFDVLVFPKADDHSTAHQPSLRSLDDLPVGARIGTGSPRRQAQLLRQRPDLMLAEIRGNIETRLRKLDDGEYDAIVLAQAGLERLELFDRAEVVLRPPLMYPAVGQAALGIECRADDADTIALLERISHAATRAEVTAERACLRELRAGCHAPVGVLTDVLEESALRLEAVVLSSDGAQRTSALREGLLSAAEGLGRQVARQLLQQGADRLIEADRQQ